MLLCFSKKSPVVRKYGKDRKMSRQNWSDRYHDGASGRRWHEGKEFSRVGDEYRARTNHVENSDSENEEGFRRNRNYSAYRSKEDVSRSGKNGKRHSYGDDMEDKSVLSSTKAMVHKESSSKTAEAFRSSMLWKNFNPEKMPKGNEVLPTFPPNRYSIGPEIPAQICPTPVTAKKKPTFRVNLDVSHYAPNEVIVQVEEDFLVTEGKHFAESDFGYETCEFYRKYPLPEGLDNADISYKINNDGILVVTGGAAYKSHTVKERHNTLSDEAIVANAKRNERRYSSYDDLAKEIENAKSGSSSKTPHVAFGDFKCVNGRYVLVVDVEGYTPEDMKVKVIGNELLVVGMKKVETKEGNEKRIIHREFTKKFTIPASADIDSVVSRMASDGSLKIECAKTK